jgi:beta-propeller uncharacterized protein DUF5122
MRAVRHVRVGVVLGALFFLGASAGAHALPPSTPDQTAFATDGAVRAIARAGGLTYIGGDFTSLRAPTGPFARVSPTSGKRFLVSPVVTGGEVRASAPDGAGGVFIGGEFNKVGGVTRNRLAHVLADGSVDPAWNPNPNGAVFALAVSGSEVFVGGDFTSIGGLERPKLAKLSATSGNAFSGFDAQGSIRVSTIAVSGSELYVGGSFNGPDSIGGEDRNYIAKLSATTGNAFTGWNPDASNIVNSIVVSGGDVYAGGFFSGDDSIGGEHRDYIAKLSATTGNAFTGWNPDASNIVNSIVVSGGDVYAGGFFSGDDSIGGEHRDYIAKLSATTGNAFTGWNPDSDFTVITLALAGSALYVGGEFNNIGGLTRNHLAKLSTTSGDAFSAWNPDPDQGVTSLAVSGPEVFVGGNFTIAGGALMRHVAKLSGSSGDAFLSFDVHASASVDTITPSGPNLFIGGEFEWINPVVRHRIAALDENGVPTPFNPMANDDVLSLAVSGGDVYAGGAFTQVGGLARNRIAKLSAASGSAFSGWNPNANERVLALAVSGDELFAGGVFNGTNSIGGQSRDFIAKLSTASGNAFSQWNPDAENTVRKLVVDGNDVYAGGSFLNSIGGLNRDFIAKLSAASGNGFTGFDAGIVNGFVDALALSGSTLYTGGGFDTIGGQSRSKIASLFTGSGNAFSGFDPDAQNTGNPAQNLVTALAVSGDEVYAGGGFTEIGGLPRNRIAALFAGSGNAFSSFNPDANGFVRALAATPSQLFVGGEFTMIGDQSREGFAQFSAP